MTDRSQDSVRTDKRVERRDVLCTAPAIALGVAGGSGTVTASAAEETTETTPESQGTATASQGPFQQAQKLTAEDGDRRDRFGWSVQVSDNGKTAVVGAPGDEDPNGEWGGSAYVFTHSDGNWKQEAKLIAEDGDSSDWFGSAVAISGDGTTAMVSGADNSNGDSVGSVYVFERADGNWDQQQELTAEDGDTGGLSGPISMSDDGTTALIGAQGDDDPNGEDAGSVYVFEYSDSSWKQAQKLTPDDGDSEDHFGWSVAVSGDGTTAIVGASRDEDPNGVGAGSAYLFEYSNGSWKETQKLTPDNVNDDDRLGWSVAVSRDGTTALVGAIENNSDDAAIPAYVFEQSDGNWESQQLTIPGEGDDLEPVSSLAISKDGTRAIIGCSFGKDSSGDATGSAYVFEHSDGDWQETQKITAQDGEEEDRFGEVVAVSGDGTTAIIAADEDDNPNGELAGAAYVFEFSSESSGGNLSTGLLALSGTSGLAILAGAYALFRRTETDS